uniref:Uncharacterized protein n=1 Tax=Oryza glaberrima TaxID=4538 RepID=I1NN66_ORYGL
MASARPPDDDDDGCMRQRRDPLLASLSRSSLAIEPPHRPCHAADGRRRRRTHAPSSRPVDNGNGNLGDDDSGWRRLATVQMTATAAGDLVDNGGAPAWVQDARRDAHRRALRRRPALLRRIELGSPRTPPRPPPHWAVAAQRPWPRGSTTPSWRCRRRMEAGARGGARRLRRRRRQGRGRLRHRGEEPKEMGGGIYVGPTVGQ